MSTWTNVTDTVLEPGQPIRSVDIIALKNNIIAVPGGAANAPRVQTAAIQDAAVTTAKLATGERMTTANVLARTAGASVGAVGTYGLMRSFSGSALDEGSTVAGSSLAFTNASDSNRSGTQSGTWRCMGRTIADTATFARPLATTVFLRIS